MENKNVYIVAKLFDGHGCIAYRCKTKDEAECVPFTLDAIRNDGVQIVLLDDPDTYAEYAPYHFVDDLKEFVLKVIALDENVMI